MSTRQDHELVPAIRAWLSATSRVDVPAGLSREEATRQARRFLARVGSGKPLLACGIDRDDLADVLWAAVAALEARPNSAETFDACDRVYQFVWDISLNTRFSDELAEILHHVATIGWISTAGGLGSTFQARDQIWEHG